MLKHMSLTDICTAGHMIREPQPSGPSLAEVSQQEKGLVPMAMNIPGEAPPTGHFHILIGRKETNLHTGQYILAMVHKNTMETVHRHLNEPNGGGCGRVALW